MDIKEESFDINPKIEGLPNSTYKVVPSWVNDESQFEIFYEGENIGTLHKVVDDNLNEGWEWIKGKLDWKDAEAIGEKIESHYS